jgi:hypothetical protein
VVVMRCRNATFRLPRHGGGQTMNLNFFDLAGFIGVLLIVIAYLLLQLDKLPSSSPSYSLLNAVGALLIIVSLIFKFNLSAFMVEAFWFLISLLGLWRSLVARKNLKLASNGRNESQRNDVPRETSG